MAPRPPVVYDAGAFVHEPIDPADTLQLNATQLTQLKNDLNIQASEVDVAPPVMGQTDTQGALTALAAAIAGLPPDVHVASLVYNATTGVMTITETDGTTYSATIGDVPFTTTTAPPTTNDPAIPTTYYGTSNAARLGNPDGWLNIAGRRVPFWN